MRSVRQSLASSTALPEQMPWCFSSLASKRSNKVKASAGSAGETREDLPW